MLVTFGYQTVNPFTAKCSKGQIPPDFKLHFVTFLKTNNAL